MPTSTPAEPPPNQPGSAETIQAIASVADAGSLRGDRITGAAGLIALGALAGFIAVSTHVDAADAVVVLGVSCLTYPPMIVYLAGLQTVARRWDRTGTSASIVGISASLFLAGALASDIGALSIPLAQHLVHDSTAVDSQREVFERVWFVGLLGAQVALAVLIGTLAVSARIGRVRDTPPRWIGWWGLLAALSIIAPLTAPDTVVFIASNLIRLSWLCVLAIWLLVHGRHA